MLTIAYLANQFPCPVEPYVGEEIEELRRRGVRVITGSVRRPPKKESPASTSERVSEVVVQSFGLSILVRAAWLCFQEWPQISGLIRRVMFRGREGLVLRLKALLHTWLGERASVAFPSGTTVVSQALQQRFRETHGVEAFYVPNGGVLREWTEPRQILEWGIEPGNYALFLGRFSPEKGCHLLVKAFEQLETSATLVMAGASSYCDDYSRELRKRAKDRIRMLDWVSGRALDELITNAMLFVLPSDLEGLSLALLDAMGAGLCVLTSDVPENREVVDGAGFTFQRGNAEDLADRLLFLIANPAVREAAGRAARKRIEEQYQWQKIASDIEKAYFELLGWNSAPALLKKPSARTVAEDAHDEQVARRAG
jgi:glycosyltransferase involved in cell wall biosynthesis